jgi:branched-chain amino acid aminotransferase
VLAHVTSYGSSWFEGIRCYATESGPAIFRLREHVRRLHDSAKIYRVEIPFSQDDLCAAMLDVVSVNKLESCYLRPLVIRGYGNISVMPTKDNPIETYIAAWEWGKYLGEEAIEGGVDVCVSSWARMAPNTLPALAKAGGHYMNSQLIRMEAEINGYSEGIALDVNGYLSEGSGENLFLVRDGILYTTPLANSVLNGITRMSVLTIARALGIPVVELPLPREMVYICDEAFFSGTAAEVTHLRSVDKIMVGDGTMGPVTTAIHDEFFAIVNGIKPDRYDWLTPVRVPVAEPVGA